MTGVAPAIEGNPQDPRNEQNEEQRHLSANVEKNPTWGAEATRQTVTKSSTRKISSGGEQKSRQKEMTVQAKEHDHVSNKTPHGDEVTKQTNLEGGGEQAVLHRHGLVVQVDSLDLSGVRQGGLW
jgi:hypothetical protein